MAQLDQPYSIWTELADRASSAVQDFRQRPAKAQLFGRRLKELRGLSRRDLAGLGMNASQLRSVAFEVAYGK